MARVDAWRKISPTAFKPNKFLSLRRKGGRKKIKTAGWTNIQRREKKFQGPKWRGYLDLKKD